jgi:hypothetical protein
VARRSQPAAHPLDEEQWTWNFESWEARDVELSAEDLNRIEEVFPGGAAAGERYPDMSTVSV